MFKQKIRKLIRNIGYDIIRFKPPTNHPLGLRLALIKKFKVGLVLDVGANIGQYASELRSIGYRGKIVSFEPLSSAFAELQKKSVKDANWDVQNYALGSFNGKSDINIAGNSASSSILEMLPRHEAMNPESKYVSAEAIEVKRLDSIASSLFSKADHVFLKIDTQGFEREVLEGAGEALEAVDIIQLEMSFEPMYSGELPFHEMMRLLENLGYKLTSLEMGNNAGHVDPISGQIHQVDGVFCRV